MSLETETPSLPSSTPPPAGIPTTTPPTTETAPAPSLLTPAAPAPVAFVPYTAESVKEFLPDASAPVLELFNKLKLDGDTAKELVKYQQTTQAEAAKATAEAWAAQNKVWQDEAKSNPDWGGQKIDQTLASVKTIITEYGDASFFEMLSLTGAGNHPAMIGFLHKLSSVLPSEGKPAVGTPGVSERSLAERLFGADKK